MPRSRHVAYLEEIDLTKASEHDCPGIHSRSDFLARIGGVWYLGRFTKQWYGWNFDDDWGASGHQFDAPGYNASQWQQLYEIKLRLREKGDG